MNTFLIALGVIVIFLIFHKILMNWQINKSIDSLMDNAEVIVKTPEIIAKQQALEKRLEHLKIKTYQDELDVLYDLSSVYILDMLNEEAGWSLDKNEFRLRTSNPLEIATRLKITHFTGQERVYQVNFEFKGNDKTKAGNYIVGLRMLDIFSQDIDTFYKA